MSSARGPLEVRAQLASLLDVIEAEPGLSSELERAKREFFGPAFAVIDPSAAIEEAKAVRFSEWFLCERESDVMGAVPAAVAAQRYGNATAWDLLQDSVVGVFLVQSTKKTSAQVREVIDNEVYEVTNLPNPVSVGDVLIGRLFESPDAGSGYLPSAAMSIVGSSPQFAVAYQRDIRNLGANRQLTQAEMEHLLFREEGALGDGEAGEAPPPQEHVEAELDKLLASASGDLTWSATAVSEALREAKDQGGFVQSLLDEFAFESDIDLDQARHLLVTLLASIRAQGAEGPLSADEAGTPTEPTVRTSPAPKPRSKPFEPRKDEKLGETLARRIEEGLAGNEAIEDVFAEVEELFGEQIEEPGDDDVDGPEAFDDGDLVPLVQEFFWEVDPDPAVRAELERFVAIQSRAPIPRTSVDSIEQDDLLRFLLERWMGHRPSDRVAAVRGAYQTLEAFFEWARNTQELDRSEAMAQARERLVDHGERLETAARALRTDRAAQQRPSMFIVVDVAEGEGVATMRLADTADEVQVRLADEGGDRLEVEDVIVGEFDAGSRTFDAMVVVMPTSVAHLLG